MRSALSPLAEGGDVLARRYLEHDIVESKLALDEYDRCHAALGFRPVPQRERRRANRIFDVIVARNGAEFRRPYGWASAHLRMKKVTFHDLEDAAQRSTMRPYYKMASYNVHADIKGITHRLGAMGNRSIVLAGASNAGFAEPGQNAAITLTQVTCLLFYPRRANFDSIVQMKLLMTLRDEVVSSFVRLERALARQHKDYVQCKRLGRRKAN